jgi:hypothetical protein
MDKSTLSGAVIHSYPQLYISYPHKVPKDTRARHLDGASFTLKCPIRDASPLLTKNKKAVPLKGLLLMMIYL